MARKVDIAPKSRLRRRLPTKAGFVTLTTVGGKMSNDPSCNFCRIVDGAEPAHIVYQDAKAIAFLDREPAAEGHTPVVPRAHSRTLQTREN